MAKFSTRVVRSLLNRAGFDLLRLQKTVVHGMNSDKGKLLDARMDIDDRYELRPVPSFDIVLRTCLRGDIGAVGARRCFELPKRELVRGCLASLIASANAANLNCPDTDITLTILDNLSSDEGLSIIKAELAKAKFSTELGSPGLEFLNNGESMRQNYGYGRKHGRDVIYFVEDDYLHDRSAITEIIRAYSKLSGAYGKDVVLFPADNPEEYRHVNPSQILLGSERHWRRSWMTTFTCVTTKAIMDTHWGKYNGLGEYGVNPNVSEHNTINLIYREVPCLTPIPSLAVHMQMFEHIPPYVDWRNWWSENSDFAI